MDPLGPPPERLGFFLVASLVVVLNQLDAVMTLLWVNLGVADEANVLWARLVHELPLVFVIAKLLVVSVGIGVLYHLRRHRLASVGLGLCAGAYVAVSAWHLCIGTWVL